MRVAIITFEIDEDSLVLAWQSAVARRLIPRCEFTLLLTEKIGRFITLPDNVKVELISLSSIRFIRKLFKALVLNIRVYQLCKKHKIGVCFVHMNHKWTYLLYPALRLLKIPMLLWYAHGTITFSLRFSHLCAAYVVTSTPEGFRIPSKKLGVIGQGIDTKLFNLNILNNERNKLVYVGRLSRRKRPDLLLDVMYNLVNEFGVKDVCLSVIGAALTPDDISYNKEFCVKLWNLNLQEKVDFVGFVPQRYIPSFYESAFLHINVSKTGSMDKSVLEALACGCPVLTSNEAFFEMFKNYPEYIIRDDSPGKIAKQVFNLYEKISFIDKNNLRNMVLNYHGIDSYIDKIMFNLEKIAV